jgi:hypothetical protein
MNSRQLSIHKKLDVHKLSAVLSLLPSILVMFLVLCIKTYFLGGIVIIKKAQFMLMSCT